ncbi:protein NRT1/ PTR FAMILY 5.2-like isoform X2 [Andrographis paniculata]|uniref:protein NRT1/ PTR FAMILY 5.2-like isoform X2 n=1 Tax=Andrographis paniculata TaxID=175694 RepID=UPI0021E91434|nr:protein NRT1/ PTR FAMILY 5.2-like isoform X2 [Andrographis paniculata]
MGLWISEANLFFDPTLVDGRLVLSSSGMSLLTLSVSIHPLKPSSCPDPNGVHCQKPTTLQIVVFFVALYIIALGNGGTKPNISTIGADQFDEFDPKEKIQKLSFFNWWAFSILFGALFATTVLIYIQDNVGWALGYGIPTIGLAISILIFLAGTPFYRHKVPMGSSLTTIIKVIVASISKWKVEIPTDAKELYELDPIEYGEGKHMIDSTNSMRFLNKACVRTSSSKPWLLSSVTQVEETKQILRMIPILIVTFIPSTMVAQIGTLFIKQGTTLNRHIGAFKIPPASLGLFVTISMLVSLVVYDRVFVKIIRKRTRNPRGITLLQRMGIGMILHIIIMVIASLTERYRIHVARKNGLVENGGQVPLSVFIILPQFILMGVADAFLEVAKLEFFYDQAPESMKSLGASYSLTSLGAGNFISSLFLTIVSNVTSGNGHEGWIRNNLNASHLDYYYAFFAILNCINFVLFLVVVRFYVYRAEVSDSMKVLAEELTVRKTEGGQ